MLTALANRAAPARSGFSQTSMVSRVEPATLPVGLVWLANGTALPARITSAGRPDAAATPPAAAVVPTAAAVAPRTATTILNLDIALLASSGEAFPRQNKPVSP
ncbi:MAG: hypothetical protein ACRDPO_24070 [Streptosporangiaceae bacterium]